MTGHNQYVYAVVDNTQNRVVAHLVTPYDALSLLREYSTHYGYGNIEYYIWRLPLLPFGKGGDTRFVNLGDVAGYVYVDYTKGDYIYRVTYIDLNDGKVHNGFFARLDYARIAHDIVFERRHKYLDGLRIERSPVFDVNTECDPRYFRILRNLGGIDYVISELCWHQII